ncbi:hypothetical protein M3_0112 [Lysinibacillus phage vB_LfM_LysYB1]|nr:hypothetical protein M3_0112 [Lysinibacillus phage vB_LfM_LysYB1]WAB25379.1 hypothetical protein M5_0201 [Lysinibacillus phage vB_LfM_LysYB2]
MRKLILMSVMLSLFLVGCDREGKTLEQAENQQLVDYDQYNQGMTEWIKVGDTVRVEKVSKSDVYELMFKNVDGYLFWERLKGNYGIKSSDKGYSYVERLPNETGYQKFPYETYIANKPVFILYLNTDDLEGGSYKRNCGENCTKVIDVDMLD